MLSQDSADSAGPGSADSAESYSKIDPPTLIPDPPEDAIEIVSSSDIGPQFFDSYDRVVVVQEEESVYASSERPMPYLIDYTPQSVVTIGWSQPMLSVEDLWQIPEAKVAVTYDTFKDFEKVHSRSLQSATSATTRQEEWFQNEL